MEIYLLFGRHLQMKSLGAQVFHRQVHILPCQGVLRAEAELHHSHWGALSKSSSAHR